MHLRPLAAGDPAHDAVEGRGERMLHLHRLEHQQQVWCASTRSPSRTVDAQHRARHGRRDARALRAAARAGAAARARRPSRGATARTRSERPSCQTWMRAVVAARGGERRCGRAARGAPAPGPRAAPRLGARRGRSAASSTAAGGPRRRAGRPLRSRKPVVTGPRRGAGRAASQRRKGRFVTTPSTTSRRAPSRSRAKRPLARSRRGR